MDRETLEAFADIPDDLKNAMFGSEKQKKSTLGKFLTLLERVFG